MQTPSFLSCMYIYSRRMMMTTSFCSTKGGKKKKKWRNDLHLPWHSERPPYIHRNPRYSRYNQANSKKETKNWVVVRDTHSFDTWNETRKWDREIKSSNGHEEISCNSKKRLGEKRRERVKRELQGSIIRFDNENGPLFHQPMSLHCAKKEQRWRLYSQTRSLLSPLRKWHAPNA